MICRPCNEKDVESGSERVETVMGKKYVFFLLFLWSHLGEKPRYQSSDKAGEKEKNVYCAKLSVGKNTW
jgi:hypothetical protein